jgi:hypothetical protein
MGITLVLAGLLPLALPVAAQEEATAEPPIVVTEQPTTTTTTGQPTGDNGYCVVCHTETWRMATLPDGVSINLYVTHGDETTPALGCLDCHGADAFPHNQAQPSDHREYTLRAVSMCTTCHTQEGTDLSTGLHQQAIDGGNRNAAVCTDCHGEHDVQNQPRLVADVCGACHLNTWSEWGSSAHLDIGPLGCATCHAPHSQKMRVESADPNEMCLNCHKPDDVQQQYVHSVHPVESEAVDCITCHMSTHHDQLDSVAAADQSTGHSMFVETLACVTCHENLVSTGQWTELQGGVDERLLEQRDDLQQRVQELEAAHATTEQSDPLIPTLQGLLVGVGFGITLAAVFFTRGQRQIR